MHATEKLLVTTERRSREETRALMLEAGSEVLLRDGISLGASTFRYADAFKLLQDEHGIKVTRGSVHERIWSTQEAWQLDVLTDTIVKNEANRREVVNEAVLTGVGDLPIDTPHQRLNFLAETCRVGSLTFLEVIDDNPTYRLFPTIVAAWKASANNLPEFDELGRVLEGVQQTAQVNLETSTAALLTSLNFDADPRRGLSFESAVKVQAMNSTALAYSHSIRSLVDPELSQRFHARCPDGEQRPWNHLGLAVWLMMRGLFTERSDQQDGPS